MKQTVTMPALSDTMNIGRLSKWLKKPGDLVKKGEAIAEVETDKAVMEVEAFYDGYLAGPLAPVDKDLPLGSPIAYVVDTAAEVEVPAAAASGIAAVGPAPAAPTAPVSTPQAAAPAATAPPAPPPSAAATSARPAPASGAVRASPYARALARSLGVDLAKVTRDPSKPVDAAELLKAATTPPAPSLEEGPPHRVEKTSSLRESVARTMIASMATPTFRLVAQLPLEPLHKLAKEKSYSLTLLLARACALTIEAHPLFNAVYTQDGIAQREQVDVGIAVDIPEGLITPVLRDVGRRPLSELEKDWDVLRDKVKTRRLVAQDYRGATFYLSDLGVFPVIESFDSIIPLGASAILSVGAAREQGAMFTLSCDHRVIFGADGARFLTTLSNWLTEPAKLFG